MNLKPYPEYKDSGVAWLGEVPKHWEIHPNRALFYERNRKNNPEMELLSVTITKGVIYQKELISNTSKKDSSNEDKSKYKLVKQGDIAYNKMRMWQGAVGASKYEGIVSPAYIIVHHRDGMDEWFYHYLFRSPKYIKESHRYSYGICDDQLSLRIDDFKRIFTPKPQLEEQRHIVKFLDYKTAQITRFIKAKKRMIELLKEQKQVIINDAVTGKIVIKDEGGRLKAEKRPDSSFIPYPSSFLQTVPEGWETRKITTVCALIIDGTHFSPKSDITGDYLYITAKNIKETGLDLKNVTYIKSADHREIYNRCPVSRSDVLYIKDGATAGIATVNPLIEEFSLLSSVALIRTKSAILAPEYLALQFNSLKFKMHVLNNLVGGAMTRFTLEIIKRFQLLIPPILEQQQIVSYIETKTAALDQAISRTEREIALMQEYRTRLISDVVTGKIDVQNIEIPDIANIDDTIDESIDEPEGEEELETEEAEE